jgi:hypothetical protein
MENELKDEINSFPWLLFYFDGTNNSIINRCIGHYNGGSAMALLFIVFLGVCLFGHSQCPFI